MIKKLFLFSTIIFSFTISADELNSGDTAWILTSTALVLFMTLPGLSLFYAGLVRSKNALVPPIKALPSVNARLYPYTTQATETIQAIAKHCIKTDIAFLLLTSPA